MNDCYIARGSCLAARKLGGEMVILSAETSHLCVLNELGTLIWEAADGKRSLAEIIADVVCRQFDVEAAAALQDAQEFVEELRRHKMLMVSNQPIEAAAAPGADPSRGLPEA